MTQAMVVYCPPGAEDPANRSSIAGQFEGKFPIKVIRNIEHNRQCQLLSKFSKSQALSLAVDEIEQIDRREIQPLIHSDVIFFVIKHNSVSLNVTEIQQIGKFVLADGFLLSTSIAYMNESNGAFYLCRITYRGLHICNLKPLSLTDSHTK